MSKYSLSPLILQHGPWSHTKLDVAENCTYRFDLQYIQKKKGDPTADPRGRIGNAAHKALELAIKGMNINRALTVGAVDYKLTTPEMDELVIYKANILAFIDRWNAFKEKKEAEKELVEYKFNFDENFKPVGYWEPGIFRGAVDLGMKTGKGEHGSALIIMDHKSGDPSPVERYKDQLTEYAIAGIVTHPDVVGVQTAIHYVKESDREKNIVWTDFIPAEHIREVLIPAFIEKMNKTMERLKEPPEPTKGWWCNFCQYKRRMCPAWKPKEE